MIGQRFGMLVVLSRQDAASREYRWLCQCDCGNQSVVITSNLTRGHTQSCGCQKGNRSHGETQSPEYQAWANMKRRCNNPNNPMYKHYGGRGITVDPAWNNSFEAFLGDMGKRPSSEHSIERDNVDGNYEPDNCRWATPAEQASNKRNSVKYEVDGEIVTQSELARRGGLSVPALRSRIDRGMSPEEAARQPTRKLIEHGGQNLTLQEWSKQTGIGYPTLYARLQRGLPMEEVLAKKDGRKGKK